MKSFIENIAEKRLLEQSKLLFCMMATYGIDPNDFVEWLSEERTNPERLEEYGIVWLENQLRLTEVGFVPQNSGWMRQAYSQPQQQAPQQQVSQQQVSQQQVDPALVKDVNDAMQSLRALLQLKPEGDGKNFVQRNPQLKNTITTMLQQFQSLMGQQQPNQQQQQPNQQQQQQPNQQQQQQQQQQPNWFSKFGNNMGNMFGGMFNQNKSPTPHQITGTMTGTNWGRRESNDHGFSDYLVEKNEINTTRHLLHEVSKCGVDPEQFVQWYYEEGQYLPSEMMLESMGDWFRRMGGQIKGAWQGMKQGWNQSRTDWNVKSNSEAVNNAVHMLQKLQKHSNSLGGQFMQHANQLLTQLQQPITDPAQAFQYVNDVLNQQNYSRSDGDINDPNSKPHQSLKNIVSQMAAQGQIYPGMDLKKLKRKLTNSLKVGKTQQYLFGDSD